MLKILVVDDDETLRLTVRSALQTRGFQVTEADDGQTAVDMVAAGSEFDVVILDVNMPRLSGLEALAQIKDAAPRTICLVLTAFTDVKDAVVAIKHGAYDYLEKPVEAERLLRLIDSATQANEMVEAASYSAPQVQFDEGKPIIGGSASMGKIFEIIYKLSKVDTSVLIRGESGTGKELVARALHFNSHRKKGPFVAVNCAAIPENLIESELFGHEKGSFTGADRKKIGKFQFANGGTIFLDEIGDISPQMQVKLLRVLQDKRFTPVGGNVEQDSDVRIIAATNRPLEKMIEKDTFRSDLFYRLNVLPIHLPPLRERREDIPALAEYMRRKFNRIHSRTVSGFTQEAMAALRLSGWPGNIRELENVIEHAFIIESTDRISLSSLPGHIQAVIEKSSGDLRTTEETIAAVNADAGTSMMPDFAELKYPVLKERFEKEFIIRALRAFNGRINQTAEHTQMTKVTLLRKLEKYGINPKEFYKQPTQ